VIPPVGGVARFLVPAQNVAADRRQRRPWCGAARATVSDSTAAFSASAAGATLLRSADGDLVHGGAGGLAGVPLWVFASAWRQSPAWRPTQHVESTSLRAAALPPTPPDSRRVMRSTLGPASPRAVEAPVGELMLQ